MDNQEAIETIKLAQSQIEWDYPMDYATAFDMAISALQAQDAPDTNVGDMLSRQSLIDSFKYDDNGEPWSIDDVIYRLKQFPSVREEPLDADDTIYRQAAIDALKEKRDSAKEWYEESSASGDEMMSARAESAIMTFVECLLTIKKLPSAQPEQPPYVAEIEAEYQKAVKMPHIHKPLAKALYEVWKKHDREDAERRTDE